MSVVAVWKEEIGWFSIDYPDDWDTVSDEQRELVLWAVLDDSPLNEEELKWVLEIAKELGLAA